MLMMTMVTMVQVSDEEGREESELPIQPRIASKQDHPQRGELTRTMVVIMMMVVMMIDDGGDDDGVETASQSSVNISVTCCKCFMPISKILRTTE